MTSPFVQSQKFLGEESVRLLLRKKTEKQIFDDKQKKLIESLGDIFRWENTELIVDVGDVKE